MQTMSIENAKGFMIKTVCRDEMIPLKDGKYAITNNTISVDGKTLYLIDGNHFVFSTSSKADVSAKSAAFEKYAAKTKAEQLYLVVKNG